MTGGRDRFTTRFLFKFGHVLTTDNIYKYKLFEFLLIVFLNTKYLNVNIVISLGRVGEVCDIMQVRERVVYWYSIQQPTPRSMQVDFGVDENEGPERQP